MTQVLASPSPTLRTQLECLVPGFKLWGVNQEMSDLSLSLRSVFQINKYIFNKICFLPPHTPSNRSKSVLGVGWGQVRNCCIQPDNTMRVAKMGFCLYSIPLQIRKHFVPREVFRSYSRNTGGERGVRAGLMSKPRSQPSEQLRPLSPGRHALGRAVTEAGQRPGTAQRATGPSHPCFHRTVFKSLSS